ncbi:MAG: RsmE family RNA methyltransferase [Myxococcota bacterium]
MSRRVRVFVPTLSAGPRELPREQAHYLTVVHRLERGASFVAFDPELGLEAEGTVTRSERTRVECELAQPKPAERRSLGVSLLQAASKGDRLEQVVRAGTALGAERIVVVMCERSVAPPSELRRERLRAIAIEAARQCERGDLPELVGPIAFADAITAGSEVNELKLCLSPRSRTPLAERIRGWLPGAPAHLLVGPEGGFSDNELSLAERAGFLDAALGPFILRTELAATAALACFVGKLPSQE